MITIELKRDNPTDETSVPYAVVTLPQYGSAFVELQAMSEFLNVLSRDGAIAGVRLEANNAVGNN